MFCLNWFKGTPWQSEPIIIISESPIHFDTKTSSKDRSSMNELCTDIHYYLVLPALLNKDFSQRMPELVAAACLRLCRKRRPLGQRVRRKLRKQSLMGKQNKEMEKVFNVDYVIRNVHTLLETKKWRTTWKTRARRAPRVAFVETNRRGFAGHRDLEALCQLWRSPRMPCHYRDAR